MKVRPVIKKNEPITNPEVSNPTINHMIPNDDTCIRCVCKSIEDIIKVNDIIHKFNHTQVDIGKQALIQVGRQYRDGVTVIYITIMASDDNNVEEKFAEYNDFLYNELSSAKIEFQFVDFERITKNVADVVSYTEDNDFKMLVIDRNTINNDEVFDHMCKYILPGIDTNHIKSIRIPYNEIVVTADCKWELTDDNGNNLYKKEEPEKEDINKNGYSIGLVQINISIFTKECNNLFNILVKHIGDRCIRKVIADYTEENDGHFFRTIHLLITDDIIGRTFYTTACNFGVASYIDNNK